MSDRFYMQRDGLKLNRQPLSPAEKVRPKTKPTYYREIDALIAEYNRLLKESNEK